MVDEENKSVPKKRIIVDISENELECYITVIAQEGEKEPTMEEARQVLKNAGILFGIKERELAEIFEKKAFKMKILIAAGIPLIDGKDAEIKYHFTTSGSGVPRELEDGSVDFKDIGIIQNVREGEVLAEVIPPVQGKDGMTITGEKLIPKVGKDCMLPKGKNTEISPDDPNKLIASIGGNVSLRGKHLVEVNPLFTIKGDIDFSTGNVKYIGVLHIKGDVKSGFSVEAEEDITIDGVVEDATVESKKNVVIKTGFIGRGEGKIKAGGNVALKYAENQTIIADGNVIASESLRHCTVESGEKVISKGKNGVILGGRITAVQGVEAKILGSSQNTKTEIEVGLTAEMQQKIQEHNEKSRANNENLKKVTRAIALLQKIKTLKKELPEDKRKLFEKLQLLLTPLQSQKDELNRSKKLLDEEILKNIDASIQVHGTVYPGVIISILNRKKSIGETVMGVTFKLSEGEIIEISKGKKNKPKTGQNNHNLK